MFFVSKGNLLDFHHSLAPPISFTENCSMVVFLLKFFVLFSLLCYFVLSFCVIQTVGFPGYPHTCICLLTSFDITLLQIIMALRRRPCFSRLEELC